MPLIILPYDLRRDAGGGGVVGDVFGDYGVGADLDVVADGNGADDLGAGANKDVVAKGGGVSCFGSNRNQVLNLHASSAADAAVDDDTVTVDEDKTGTELGPPSNDAAPENRIDLVEEHDEGREMATM